MNVILLPGKICGPKYLAVKPDKASKITITAGLGCSECPDPLPKSMPACHFSHVLASNVKFSLSFFFYFLVLRACFTRFSMTPSNASLSPICSSVRCCQ